MSRLAAVALSITLLLSVAAQAEPVCGLPAVLRVVAAELDARGIRGELVGDSVGEESRPGGATVRCSVKLLLPYYDTNAAGYATQYRMVVRGYQVRRFPYSLRVDLLD